MTERPHIVVLHRWQDRYADYESYVDHRAAAVTYVTTEFGVEGVPEGASGIALVAATDDLAQTREAVDTLAARHGEPARIIALKEDDLLIAAQLRAERDVPGPAVADLLPFRDKLVMARTAAGAGIPQPAFAPVSDRRSVAAFAAEHGWPVVVKPRLGSASVGVSKVDGPDGLAGLALDGGQLVQSFDPGVIYHVDGVFDGVDLGPWRASRYLNTCLGFRHGDVLGSVEEDDDRVNRAIGAFTRRVLRGMANFAMAFHLEVFVDVAPDGEVGCRFLEIGARVGGAEIAFLWREVHGYDLMETSFRMGLGQPAPPGATAGGEVTGWLLVPAPTERPCRIVAVTSMLDEPDGPYAEFILKPGDILPPADAYYEHVGGRFRFRGASTAEVAAKILATAKAFEVRGVRVDREENLAEI
jgi:hypothetical protein